MTNDNVFYNNGQRVVQQETMNDEWQQITSSKNELQRMIQWVTANDNEWFNKWQRMSK